MWGVLQALHSRGWGLQCESVSEATSWATYECFLGKEKRISQEKNTDAVCISDISSGPFRGRMIVYKKVGFYNTIKNEIHRGMSDIAKTSMKL